MSNRISYLEARGERAKEHLIPLAELRMRVFRDFPYLYDGDFEYEKKYLNTYFSSPHSFVIFAQDKDRNNAIIGASTAILLSEEEEAFKKPFLEQEIDPASVCYFGESVLLSEYRGLGIGKEFMRVRLQFAKEKNMRLASFCAVVRASDHPLRPEGYRPLDEFWKNMGFHSVPGITTKYQWKDIDQEIENYKTMQFWLKEL